VIVIFAATRMASILSSSKGRRTTNEIIATIYRTLR
jgi:hypothetical protein